VEKQKALSVPDVAVQFDQGGRYVLVLNDENIVQQKRIRMGQQVERMRVIEEGITAEDRVIVGGWQRARPGTQVKPVANSNQDSTRDREKKDKPNEK
jgi:hypothetical protein